MAGRAPALRPDASPGVFDQATQRVLAALFLDSKSIEPATDWDLDNVERL